MFTFSTMFEFNKISTVTLKLWIVFSAILDIQKSKPIVKVFTVTQESPQKIQMKNETHSRVFDIKCLGRCTFVITAMKHSKYKS